MDVNNVILIVAAEIAVACLFVTVLVFLKNRRLRKLVNQLKARMKETEASNKGIDHSPPPLPAIRDTPYTERLDQQLLDTKEHHYNLGNHQDISLDLDPDAPLPRRTAALRYAFLIAEKEATAGEQVNWEFLANRYQQLLSFNEDYAPESSEQLRERLTQIQEELQQAKKRINNLERFKAMYFELEERWEKCKDTADVHYSELKNMAANSEQPDDFCSLLEQYHASYADLGVMIETGVQEAQADPEIPAESQLHELRRLRSVAAEQHLIISELQSQLSGSFSSEEQVVVVESLKTELTKQARYLQESETCIRLMEDELATANRQLEQLRDRANQATQLKAQTKELQDKVETHDQMMSSLKQENRHLTKKLKVAQEAPPEDNEEIRGLRKEINALQSRYNDLEEKFLNLKLKE